MWKAPGDLLRNENRCRWNNRRDDETWRTIFPRPSVFILSQEEQTRKENKKIMLPFIRQSFTVWSWSIIAKVSPRKCSIEATSNWQVGLAVLWVKRTNFYIKCIDEKWVFKRHCSQHYPLLLYVMLRNNNFRGTVRKDIYFRLLDKAHITKKHFHGTEEAWGYQ